MSFSQRKIEEEIKKLTDFIDAQHEAFIEEIGCFAHMVLFNEFSQLVDVNSLNGQLEIVQMIFEQLNGGVSTEISTWTSIEDFSTDLKFSSN